MEKKHLNQLKKAYKARLKILNNKKFLGDIGTSVLSLVEQLRYLRDTLIIEKPIKVPKPVEPFIEFSEGKEIENTDGETLSTLVAAIAEFDAYLDSDDLAQRNFHFNNFWEFVKLNIEEWLMLNDTI